MTYFQTHGPHVTHIHSELAGYKYKALSQATRPVPSHAVLSLLIVKPASQLAQIEAPCSSQAAPDAAVPSSHWHTFAAMQNNIIY